MDGWMDGLIDCKQSKNNGDGLVYGCFDCQVKKNPHPFPNSQFTTTPKQCGLIDTAENCILRARNVTLPNTTHVRLVPRTSE